MQLIAAKNLVVPLNSTGERWLIRDFMYVKDLEISVFFWSPCFMLIQFKHLSEGSYELISCIKIKPLFCAHIVSIQF